MEDQVAVIIYGFAKDYMFDGDGTMKVQVRIPSIHGPYRQQSTKQPYTLDKDLPWYTSLLLPNFPNEGDVLAIESVNEAKSSDLLIIGMTGGNYHNGSRI